MSSLFVTVGSTRFDELVDRVLKVEFLKHAQNLNYKKLIIQAGKSNIPEYTTAGLDIDIYSFKSDISIDAEKADLVISHGGAGTCLEMLRLNKKLLIVVNAGLMDNHQSELANQLEQDGYAMVAPIDNLEKRFVEMHKRHLSLREFPKQTSKFEEIIDATLNKVS